MENLSENHTLIVQSIKESVTGVLQSGSERKEPIHSLANPVTVSHGSLQGFPASVSSAE